MLVDSHSHIDGAEFDADRDEVLARARAAGVSQIVVVGTGDPHAGDLERAVNLAEKESDVWATIGVHPHDARLFDEAAERRLRELLKRPRVIALGEIGLDFHYDNSPRDAQQSAFRRQTEIAKEFDLPVVIHTREAEQETIEILRAAFGDSSNREKLNGVMHCFTGSRALARAALELGFMISFAGIVTFKKAEELRAVARNVPLERMLVETDAPYLAPVPFRGKRCEPAFVVETARFLAELRGIDFHEFARITTENFTRLFVRKS
jgi:TatD DNase family protein